MKWTGVMRPELSVHDNNVYAYSVDCESRRLVLHTAFRDSEPHEFTDVIFHDVVAHHFEHVLSGNILYSVNEADVADVVRENARLLADSWRHGWPTMEYRGNLDAHVDALKAAAVRAYKIDSSYGLSGWVFAGSCERVPRSKAARHTGSASLIRDVPDASGGLT